MKNKSFFFLFALIIISLTACEVVSSIFIVVETPYIEKNQHFLQSDKNILFRIIASSKTENITNLTIKSYDNIYGLNILLDTTFNWQKKYIEYDFFYTPQKYNDTTTVELQYEIKTESNKNKTYTERYNVLPDRETLNSFEAISIYSAASQGKSGFSFYTMNSIFVNETDSSLIDIYDVITDSTNLETLSRKWSSNTDLLFGRFQDFNFDNATTSTIKEAYKLTKKDISIINLSNNDIILVGRKDEAIGVIKIVDIDDEEGIENDRYIINVKKL